MVETITTSPGSVPFQCNMLFLTNRQAGLVDLRDVSGFLQAMRIRPPRMVINLLPSHAFHAGSWAKAHHWSKEVSAGSSRARDFTFSEKVRACTRTQAGCPESRPSIGLCVLP
jgi:hypothetical protein